MDYGAGVVIRALIPEERAEAFQSRIQNISGGAVEAKAAGERFQAVPMK